MSFLDNIKITALGNSLTLPNVPRNVFDSCLYVAALDVDFLDIVGGRSVEVEATDVHMALSQLQEGVVVPIGGTRFGMKVMELSVLVQPIIVLRASWALAHAAELAQQKQDPFQCAHALSFSFPAGKRTGVGTAMDAAVRELVRPVTLRPFSFRTAAVR